MRAAPPSIWSSLQPVMSSSCPSSGPPTSAARRRPGAGPGSGSSWSLPYTRRPAGGEGAWSIRPAWQPRGGRLLPIRTTTRRRAGPRNPPTLPARGRPFKRRRARTWHFGRVGRPGVLLGKLTVREACPGPATACSPSQTRDRTADQTCPTRTPRPRGAPGTPAAARREGWPGTVVPGRGRDRAGGVSQEADGVGDAQADGGTEQACQHGAGDPGSKDRRQPQGRFGA